MKIFFFVWSFVFFLVVSTSTTLAAPFNTHDKNPNVVAFYDSGLHEVVGEFEDHSGMDLVMMAGKSGNFHQWFYGTSSTEGQHGVHTLWLVSKGDECLNGWMKVEEAHLKWGDYFLEGVDYCVHQNLFHGEK